MRIREFTIDRFGTLAGQHVPRLADGITVILGDNEAGKSTCLNFFRAMLFGYSRAHKNLEFLTDKNGSGSLLLETDAYGLLRLFRESGTRGGTPVFTNPDGSPRPDADLASILRGCSVDLYDRVFAFSLSELMQVSSLSDDRIRHALHGAAFGTGLKSPGQVLKALDAEMTELFLPKGSKPKINVLLRELDDVTETIKKRGNEVVRYAELTAQLGDAAALLASSRAARAALEEDRRTLERTASLRQRWEESREAETVLASLPEVPGVFTADGRERADRLAERIEDRAQALRAASLAQERAEKELASLAYDETLAAAAGKIFALAERKESVRNAVSRIEALRAEADTLSRSAESVCVDLGPGWNAEKLRTADFSLAVFEQCETLGQSFFATETALGHAHAEASRQAREKAVAETALEETRAALREVGGGDFGVPDVPEDETAIGGFETRAERLAALLTRAEDAAANTGALATAARNAEHAYDAAVTAIDAGWSRENFERVSLQPADRENVLALARTVTDHETRLTEEEREYKAAERAHDEASFRVTDGEASLARRIASLDLSCATAEEAKALLDSRRGVLRRVQAEFARLEGAAAAYASVNEQLGDITNLVRVARPKSAFPWSLVVLFLAVLGLVCGGGLYFFDLGGTPEITQHGLTALVCGGAFLVAWLALFAKGGDGSADAMDRSRALIEERLVKKREEAEKAAKEAKEGIAALVGGAPDMFPGGTVTAASLAETDMLLAGRRETYVAVEREAESLYRETTALAGAARRLESAERAVEHARETLERAEEVWGTALRSYGLPESVPVSDARFLLERLDTASARRAAYLGRVADMETARERIGECQREAKAIPDLAGMFASLPEPDSHFAPDHGPWLALVREYLASWKNAGRERIRLRDLAHMRRIRAEEVAAKHTEAVTAFHVASSAHENAVAAWTGWLEQHSLAVTLSPETARRALDAASKAKTALENAARLDAQAEMLAREQDAFLREFALLQPGDISFADALSALDSLVEKARENSEKAAVVAARERELPALRDAVILAEEHLAASQSELCELLALAGCERVEPFRAVHAKWVAREEALAVARASRVSLEREAADANLSLESLAASFADTSASAGAGTGPDMFAARVAELDEKLGEALAAEHALAEQKGKLDAAMAGLLSEEGLADLLAKRESVTGEIESLAREWTRLAVAKKLLLRAKGKFESERRGGVAKYAGDLFCQITDGAYTGITVSLDGEGVSAVAKDGSVKEPQSQLSRGTREQLYLALRLAYVVNHGNEAEKLPVVMDDILVNFDAKRAANTARALATFANDHQVLFFTCHKQTADTLSAASANAVRYTLEKGIFREE
ncbi:MAG: hypothetical protein DELT_02338 [Desulfovibrio sp.]